MVVRIERKSDGTNGQIVLVEEMMNVIWDSLVADGRVIEACRPDYLIHADKFVFGPSGALIERDMGLSLEAYTDDLLKTRPHWAPVSFADEELETFGEGTSLLRRAAYLKKYGQEKFDLEMQRWGCSPYNLKPGVKPATGTDQTTASKITDPRLSKAAIERDTNPFTKLRRADGSIDPAVQERIAGMIKAMGASKVAAIAAAVGKTITGLPLAR